MKPPPETVLTVQVIRGAGAAVDKYTGMAYCYIRNLEWRRRNLGIALEHARTAVHELEALLEKERKAV